MSAILEAYWLLAAKRFVDNVCMALDKKIMGAMAHKMQGMASRTLQAFLGWMTYLPVNGRMV